MLDTIKGHKTWGFFALVLITALAGLVGFDQYQPSTDQALVIQSIVALVGILLRKYTDTPIGKKE